MSKYRKSVIVNVVRPTKPLMLGDFSKIVFLYNYSIRPCPRHVRIFQKQQKSLPIIFN